MGVGVRVATRVDVVVGAGVDVAVGEEVGEATGVGVGVAMGSNNVHAIDEATAAQHNIARHTAELGSFAKKRNSPGKDI